MKFGGLLVCCAVVVSICAPAQECSGNTAEVADCYDAQYQKADAELNRVYRHFLTKLRRDDVDRLRSVQKLWLAYRDANCEADYRLYTPGTAAPAKRLECLAATTRARTAELERMYKGVDER